MTYLWFAAVDGWRWFPRLGRNRRPRQPKYPPSIPAQ